MLEHEFYIKRCNELALNGVGYTSPNPLVGSVIVHNNTIIGEGFHKLFGEAHAERNAIYNVREKYLLPQSTLYVNLEPCAHFGKTPPCADLIIENKIPNVVIGIEDPFEKVSGKGTQKLRDAGINVTVGILKDECYELNKRFLTYHAKKRPYIILKWAQTRDGFIAREDFSSKWISNSYSRLLTHKWRSEEDCILVGTNTALYDDPQLTSREMSHKNPVRIILDREGKLPENYKVFDGNVKTFVLTENPKPNKNNLKFAYISFAKNAFKNELLAWFYQRQFLSVFVEGGSALLNFFIEQDIWDEARVFTGEPSFGKGISAPTLICKNQPELFEIGSDKLLVYRK